MGLRNKRRMGELSMKGTVLTSRSGWSGVFHSSLYSVSKYCAPVTERGNTSDPLHSTCPVVLKRPCAALTHAWKSAVVIGAFLFFKTKSMLIMSLFIYLL